MNTLLSDRQVSLIHTLSLPDHSVSNHLAPTVVALTRYPSALQLLVSESDFRHRYAGSSGIPGRIEFVIILRTGRSPPAAPHPASWRRSCIRFQAGERIPGEDLHLSDCACSQAHIPPASAAFYERDCQAQSSPMRPLLGNQPQVTRSSTTCVATRSLLTLRVHVRTGTQVAR